MTSIRSKFVCCAICVFSFAAELRAVDTLSLFENHCFGCHSRDEPAGKFALDTLLEAESIDKGKWKKIWKIVKDGFMPPIDGDRMPEHDRLAMTRWIESHRLGVDRSTPDPGRVTVRRLNRMEYEYTIADLFGVDVFDDDRDASVVGAAKEIRLRDLLPPDDTAFGFDNIGDFQTLSPALFEKFLNIAEFVVERVVDVDGPQPAERKLTDVESKDSQSDQSVEHAVALDIATTGDYEIAFHIEVGAFASYRGAFRFQATVDGKRLVEDQEIEVGGNQSYRFSGSQRLTAGVHQLQFVTTPIKPDYAGKLNRLTLTPRIILKGPLDPKLTTYPEPHRRIFFAGAASADLENRRRYADQILTRIAKQAFRRPVDSDYRRSLVDQAMSATSFEQGIAQGILSILTSPQFLYRTEFQPRPDDPKSIHRLDDFALASRLSNFLWLSFPDDELFELAENGKLNEHFPAQLHRMLKDRKSSRFFEDFSGQWLRTRNVLMTPVSREHDSINRIRDSLKRETEMFFEFIARNDRDLIELVTADYTFLNRELADFYGIPLPQNGWQRVTVPADSYRGGLFGQGVFLFSTSNPGRTSPVKRGLFVLENLLAIEPPPPPPSVPSLDEVKASGKPLKTVREQLAKHREDASCAACHAHFDPIGLALENFDAIGLYRTTEEGEPIAPNEMTTTGETLTGIDDLKLMFKNKRSKFYASITGKLLTYALGRGLEPDDEPTIESIVERVSENGGKFSTLIEEIVMSRPFQYRRGEDGVLPIATRVNIPKPPSPEDRDGRKFERLIFPEGRPKKPVEPKRDSK